LSREGGLWAWGSVPGERNSSWWRQMSVGDWVLCVYGNVYRFVARVTLTLEDDALARRVWGETTDGATWSLMYFLSRPTKISVPVDSLTPHLNNGYRGFTRISDERIARIEADFGSLGEFVQTKLLGSLSESRYFLIRSNEDSAYADELGVRY